MNDQKPYDPAQNIRAVMDKLALAAAAHLAGNVKDCRRYMAEASVNLAAARGGYDKHYPVNLKRRA